MHLKVTNTNGVTFDGKVTKVIIPTQEGDIAVLEGHQPIITIVRGGLLKFTPEEKDSSNTFKKSDFLFENEQIVISVGRGIAYIDSYNVQILTSSVTTLPTSSNEILSEMKENLQKKVEELRKKGSIEDIENILSQIEKVNADMKLTTFKQI